MKAFLYKAKGALALALAMSMFCPQVFAADALSAEQQGVQAAPVVVLTEEELAAQALPKLTFEEALQKAKKNSLTKTSQSTKMLTILLKTTLQTQEWKTLFLRN